MTVSLAVSSSTAPVSTTLPWSITTTWVQVCSTSDKQVGGDDDRTPGRGVVGQHSPHRLDLGWVEPIGRLVQYQQGRQAEHGLGDAEPLPHPVAVAAHLAVDGRTKSGDLQRLVQVSLLQRATGGLPVRHQVRHAGEVRQEAGPSMNAPTEPSTSAPACTGSPLT